MVIDEILKSLATGRATAPLTPVADRDLNHILATGLGPAFWYLTGRTGEQKELSPPQLQSLMAADLTASAITESTIECISTVLGEKPDLAEKTVLLKGIGTGSQFYPQPHMRTMGDIDLLVRPHNLEELESLFQENGFDYNSGKPAEFYKDHHHGQPLFHPQKNIWVEVHRALFSPQFDLATDQVFSTDNLFGNTVKFDFHGHETNVLSNELQLIYTATHWATAFPFPKGFMPMLDILFILNHAGDEFDWDKTLAWLQNSAAAGYVYLCLAYLKHRNLFDIDANYLSALNKSQKRVNRISRKLLFNMLDNYLVAGKSFGKISSEHNIAHQWLSLISSRSANRNLVKIPYFFLFPPERPDRFHPRLAFRRLLHAIWR